MPLIRAFQRLVEGGLIVSLPPRPPLQPTPLGFRIDLHCAYHQRASHDTDSYTALRHVIHDLIDQGLVDLGHLEVTTDPLPTHDTRAVPLPSGGIHSIEFLGDEIFMMGWDGMERLLDQFVCIQTQTLMDTPMVNRSPGHLD